MLRGALALCRPPHYVRRHDRSHEDGRRPRRASPRGGPGRPDGRTALGGDGMAMVQQLNEPAL